MLQMWRAMEPAEPLSWPVEACFIAADTVFGAYVARYQGCSLAARALPLGSALATITVRTRISLEQRRARQLGLTIETAPQPNLDCLQLAPSLVWRGYLMVRGLKPAESAWHRSLAQRIVVEINRRREWRRALDTRVATRAGDARSNASDRS
jgi:hypothetical protein